MKVIITLKDGYSFKADIEQGHIDNFKESGAKVERFVS